MEKVLTNHITSHKEMITIICILILTLGGIIISVLGLNLLGWMCIFVGSVSLYIFEKDLFWKTPFLIPILILGIVSVISYLVTTFHIETTNHLSRFWAAVVLCVVYCIWAKETHRQLLLTLGLLVIGLGLAIISPLIVQWGVAKGGFLPAALYTWLPDPMVVDTVHPNIIASLMILLLPISLAYFIILTPILNRHVFGRFVLLFLISFVMLIPLLLSKSRAGLLAAGLSFIFLLWFCQQQKLAKFLLGILGVITIISIFLSVQSLQNSTSNVLDTSSLQFRMRVWEIDAMMLQDFPFTGVGIGTFNITAARFYPAFTEMNDNPGAHNLFFQIGADLGLIGLIAMMAIYILALYMGRESIRFFAAREETLSWAMSAGLTTGLIAILFHGITDINVWGTRGTFAPWMVMGLIGGIYASTRLAKV